jgi:hypothetical protein
VLVDEDVVRLDVAVRDALTIALPIVARSLNGAPAIRKSETIAR